MKALSFYSFFLFSSPPVQYLLYSYSYAWRKFDAAVVPLSNRWNGAINCAVMGRFHFLSVW